MNSVLNLLQKESPVTLARETVWRAHRRWKQLRLTALLDHDEIPVRYNSAGYYPQSSLVLSEEYRPWLLAYTAHIIAGRFPRFGYAPVELGNPPNWQLDFVSGKQWPLDESDSLLIAAFDGSDVKVPWELSRLQFLPLMGKAWRLTRDLKIRECSMNLLADWINKNPAQAGINWTIAMEAALRSISICLFLELLLPFDHSEQEWLRKATRSLWEHLHFIEAHNEFSHFARSNHYLSNIVGLLFLSAYLEGPGTRRRFERYSSLVQQEIIHQVYSDGVDYEASVGYHLLILQMFTSSLRLMKSRGIPVSGEFVSRWRGMYKFLAVIADQRGHLPQVGDCDDGRVELLGQDVEQMVNVPAEEQDSLIATGPLQVCQYLEEEVLDDSAQAGTRLEASRTAKGKIRDLPSRSSVFPISGVAIARQGAVEALFFAMPNGIGGKGSHTHNDKLSVIMRIKGVELLMDAGTFCYTRDPQSRNRFRATAYHNTVRVDEQEQNEFSKNETMLFRLQDDAQVSRIESEESEDEIRLWAEHTGYKRFGVVHGRMVRLRASGMTVKDVLGGVGEHSFEVNWHIPEPWSVRVVAGSGGYPVCEMCLEGRVTMGVDSQAELEMRTAVVPVARTYGCESRATRVTVSGRAMFPLELTTKFSWEAA